MTVVQEARKDGVRQRGRHVWEWTLAEQLAFAGRLKSHGLSGEELGRIKETLRLGASPRLDDVFEEVLADRTLQEGNRLAAGDLLRRSYTREGTDASTLRGWWEGGDAVLREHALRRMGVVCRDVVERVASDPAHPLHAVAVGRLCEHSDAPRHLGVKLVALRHTDPAVRAAAAGGLKYDHPAAAEGPLLGLTGDPDPKVAAAACGTLDRYPSHLAFQCLCARQSAAAAGVARAAGMSRLVLSAEVFAALGSCRGRVRRYVRGWLRPVWPLMDRAARYGEEEPDFSEEPWRKVPARRLLRLLRDPEPDQCRLENLLPEVRWEAYTAGERRRLLPALLGHEDDIVRTFAADACLAWGRVDGLASLLADRETWVRDEAMGRLACLPPDPSAAGLAWDYLGREGTVRVSAALALRAFARHAPLAQARGRLAEVADDADRPGRLRAEAVTLLRGLGAVRELKYLLAWLDQPPAGSWDLHVALLDAARRLKLGGFEVGWLSGIDHLHVQRAVAPFVCR